MKKYLNLFSIYTIFLNSKDYIPKLFIYNKIFVLFFKGRFLFFQTFIRHIPSINN